MDDETPPFAVDQALAEKAVKIDGDVKSPKIPPFAALNRDEKKLWEYICSQLREAEIEHLTSGLTMSVIVRTFRRWIDAEDRLTAIENENFGTYIIETPNGHAQPHQAFYVARSLKAELLKWLPECCLTIPSLMTARQKIGAKPPMDDLFGDMQSHAAAHPSAAKAALH